MSGLGRSNAALLKQLEEKNPLLGLGCSYSPYPVRYEEAIRIAPDVGFLVALKILSPDVTHKSDVSGVALDLENAEAVDAAAQAMQAVATVPAQCNLASLYRADHGAAAQSPRAHRRGDNSCVPGAV